MMTDAMVESIRVEIATMTIDPGMFLSIQMTTPYTPTQLRDIREAVRAMVPPGVYILVLPHDAQLTKIDVHTPVDDQQEAWAFGPGDRVTLDEMQCCTGTVEGRKISCYGTTPGRKYNVAFEGDHVPCNRPGAWWPEDALRRADDGTDGQRR